MRRYITNYTVVAGTPNVLVNHVTTVDDAGQLVSVEPFTAELAYTRYLSLPLVIMPANVTIPADATIERLPELLMSMPVSAGEPVKLSIYKPRV